MTTATTISERSAAQGAKITGQGISRVDGRLKVCGTATYAAEFALPRMVHAVLVTSTVPSARITQIDSAHAAAMPGVLAVMTHANAMRLPKKGQAGVKPPAGRVLSLLQEPVVHYNNEPVAVVVADSFERAMDAAHHVQVHYATEAAVLTFDGAKTSAHPPKNIQGKPTDSASGDAAAGLAAAGTLIDVTYTTPIEHHNPMEPHATLAAWHGDELTVYDATQYVTGVGEFLGKTFGMAQEKVTVVCPYVGGGFGSKGSAWSHVVLAAMAAKHVGRPVKLVLDRTQMFGPVGNRPHTEQQLRLGADAHGKFTAITHDVVSETSVLEDWTESSAMVTRMSYQCDNIATTHRLAVMNVGVPTFMRAPGEATGSFALECTLDELAHTLQVDPVELRLRNYAEEDPEKKKPFSSKSLRECYRVGAERFGWSRRNPQPGAVTEGRWRVGMGMATATYPANRSESAASVKIMADGTAVVQSGTQDLGTGTYTVMTQVAADALGFPVDKVKFELGDSRYPKAPVSGGSQSAASVSPAVQAACAAVREKLIALAVKDTGSPHHGKKAETVTIEGGWLRSVADTGGTATHDAAAGASDITTGATGATDAEPVAALIARHGGTPVEAAAHVKPGPESKEYSMHSFGAVFVEAHVDADLGTVRLPRIVAVYGVGRLLNAKTGHSQLMGGIIYGVGAALMEDTWRDERNGRYVNGNLAEYHVPVNADIGEIDITVLDEVDPHINPLGAKGIGEIGITGVAAAIANAVFNATGKRIRDMPLTLDKLI